MNNFKCVILDESNGIQTVLLRKSNMEESESDDIALNQAMNNNWYKFSSTGKIILG